MNTVVHGGDFKASADSKTMQPSIFCVCFTSSMVPQDGHTPPLLHIGQLAAGSKHRTGPDKSTNKHERSPVIIMSAFSTNKPSIQVTFYAMRHYTKSDHVYVLFHYMNRVQLVHTRTRLNTESKYIFCTVYNVSVCVHTQLSSKPWPACRLLRMPGTGRYWTSAHSLHKLQCKKKKHKSHKHFSWWRE